MPLILKTEVMAVNSKDIEILWKQYSEDEVNKGISVAQFFESNGIPYHCFEKWYKKKYSKTGIVDCIVSGSPDGTVEVPEGEGFSLVFPIFPIFHRSSSFTNVSKNHRVGSIF